MSYFKELDIDSSEASEPKGLTEEENKISGEGMVQWLKVMSVEELKAEYVFQIKWGKDRLKYAKWASWAGNKEDAKNSKKWAMKNFTIAQQFHRELCRRGE